MCPQGDREEAPGDVEELAEGIRRDVEEIAVSFEGVTPLHWASCGEVAEVLLEHGADVSARSRSGLTPLHTAIDVDVVRVLLRHGARLDARDRCGNTPLHFASLMGLSFERRAPGPSIEAQAEQEEEEPLPRWARVLLGLIDDSVEVMRLLELRFDVVGALTEAGADAGATNEVGSTPEAVLRLARSGGGDD